MEKLSMNQVIKIPTQLYQRLGIHAEGFDTPANVIERILDYYEENKGIDSREKYKTEGKIPVSLKIIYYPSDEQDFKQTLLQTKKAYIMLHKMDGTKEFKEWNASNINRSSDINGNLRSGYLRGWKSKGIYKAEISTNQKDFN
ncbi:MAG: hypothetical protein HN921_10090 [Bacteroidetes bacterium]|jgi:hypothetical protein|nr:hypothetical protein [Bacteroidota bacterium]